MSWQRGELWLDPDLPWFGEGRDTPAVATFAPASFPSFSPPPGLAASRQRREAWRRRRNLRRARATALVLSPAVIFPLALLRNGGVHRPTAFTEDPPSQTYRLRMQVPTEESMIAARGSEAVAAAQAKRLQLSVAPVEEAPKIQWHHARSVGLPYGGNLIDGTQLPLDGPNWVTWSPVTDSVPNAPKRLYGNERTIRAIVAVTEAYRAANPDAPRVVIGDISREGGGPMTDEHVSHQNGLDVDVYYPRIDGKLRAPVSPGEIDHRLAQDLLDRFVAAGAQMVFVGYSTELHGPAGIVISYANHENHMHVRFPPPGG